MLRRLLKKIEKETNNATSLVSVVFFTLTEQLQIKQSMPDDLMQREISVSGRMEL